MPVPKSPDDFAACNARFEEERRVFDQSRGHKADVRLLSVTFWASVSGMFVALTVLAWLLVTKGYPRF